ncbi:Cof-type HAD-IIB family hydrolase [Spiroplasma chrysopicola]|uniref:Putative HAD superfamily hydrolase n=1 Tax=Spiroplasma chrysopicola DF-1 TaxID=1276227 RepID=R4U409_9MOLU|nr:Cof-type HAD-IIB family hydrolase [Spiroplasma chrysopicola]AGM25283.1 putative HAD superfamily hydrolase [Spiroplasma chrysopicola DF-1]
MNTKIKLVAVDLDGTSLNSKGLLSPRTVNTFQKLNQLGIKLVIASGRPLYQINHLVEKVGLKDENDYSIALNGAVVGNNFNGEVLYEDHLPTNFVDKLVADAKELGISTIIMFENQQSTFNFLQIYCQNFNDEITAHYFANFKSKSPTEVVLVEYQGEDNLKIGKLFMAGPIAAIAAIARVWEGRLEISHEVKTDHAIVEITKKGTNKAWGLKQLCKLSNIKAIEVMAFGNEQNDVEMLKWAGIGIAVANAGDHIKKHANITCLSNDEDGVAEALEKYFKF